MNLGEMALRVLAFVVGLVLLITTLRSAILTFVLPRVGRSWMVRTLFLVTRMLFNLIAHRRKEYEGRDRVMALYAPISLLLLPVLWLLLTIAAFAAIFWAFGVPSWGEAFRESGSSLLTLGFAAPPDALTTVLGFIEGIIGIILAALLIAYLPAMYAAFSKRETLVTLLEVRAGSPPSASVMFKRLHRLGQLEQVGQLTEVWRNWEVWFAELDETHTSLAALPFYRSPRPEHSWVTAAGTILDAAALAASTLDIPRDAYQDICIRSGYLAMRHIADFFLLPYDPDPHPGDPISVTRQEFDEVYDDLKAYGIAVKPDRDKAWLDFAGWRVNYDSVLLNLAVLTMAPMAPWSSDRVTNQRVIPKVRDGDTRQISG